MKTLSREEIDQLSADEKMELIENAWISLYQAEHEPVPEWHKKLLDERLAAHDANPDAGASWEEVERRILGGETI